MGKTVIVTDSSAYLPQELVEKYNISVVPLTLHWDGESYRDGVDIQAEEFYTRLSGSKTLPTTSQVTVGTYMQVFQPLLESGYDVFSAGLSSGISASYNSAQQAKIELGNPDNLVLLDSQLVSMALSLMVIELARAVENGAGVHDLTALSAELFPKIAVYFTVDTLEYLHKGGRINSAKRLLGSAINLKPIMEIRGGKIELVESVRSRKKAITRMLDLVEKHIDGREPVSIAPFHALCLDEANEMEAEAVSRFNPVEVFRSEVSPVVGSHTGPGTLAIAVMAG